MFCNYQARLGLESIFQCLTEETMKLYLSSIVIALLLLVHVSYGEERKRHLASATISE